MGFGMGCYCSQTQSQSQHLWQNLSAKQKQTVRLAQLQCILKDGGVPNATKGWGGMLKAHAILKKRNAHGILIGGLAENIWNPKATKDDLSEHKDVDILVLSPFFRLKERFEGGIDWWLPCQWKAGNSGAMLDYWDLNAKIGLTYVNWWQNGHSVVLDFQVTDIPKEHLQLAPGLYLPSPQFVASMRAKEKLANSMNQVTEEEIGALEHKILRTLKNKIPKYIKDIFKLFILDDRFSDHFPFYPNDYFEIQPYRDTLISAIKKLAERLPAP